VPVSAYVLPSDSTKAARALPDFLDQLRFLENTLGPYPPQADKYGIAQTPFLGMEHQSIIAYGHDFTTGGIGYDAPFDALHFHELAHEWYGNLVTAKDWKDFWLHEGPATYLEALYAEHLEGDSAYHVLTDYYRSQVEGGTAIARREPTTTEDIYHRDVYYRGALILHTLRYVVGEASLRRILRQFTTPASGDGPAFRHVTTRDFRQLAETISGRSLGAFFEVYLYQSNLPVLEADRRSGTLRLQWTETGDAVFEVPVPVRVNDSTRRVAMDGGTGAVSVPEGAEVEVDPKRWILRAGTRQ
jgi:aminopeptidase N